MGDFLNSKIFDNSVLLNPHDPRSWGAGVLGRTRPVRAVPVEDTYDEEGDVPGMVDGYEVCLTEVKDWPHSADTNGFSFNQSSLYGVRTRTWRSENLTGDPQDDWVAVPKTLPGAYTDMGRCGRVVPIIQDFCDHSSWSVRTANAVIPDISTPEGSARSLWVPMNRNNEGQGGGTVPQYFPIYVSGTSGDYYTYLGGAIASSHIGFRGCKIKFYKGNGADSGTDTWEIGYRLGSEPGLSSPLSADDWYTGLTSVSVSYTSSDFAAEEVIDVGSILPPGVGIVADFVIWCKQGTTDGDTGNYTAIGTASSYGEILLAPRLDVPLWYFSSYRNKCAPGGIIMP